MNKRNPLLLFALLLPCFAAVAQNPQPCACCGEEFRQFDFWLGEWAVYDSAHTRQIGSSVVSRAEDSCVIHEQWTSAGSGVTGQSFNTYDNSQNIWRQFWVDNQGSILELYGNPVGGSMVMTNQRPDAEEVATLQQITWTPLDDGRVRQTWRTSRDKGQTWQVLFDGFYEKREE